MYFRFLVFFAVIVASAAPAHAQVNRAITRSQTDLLNRAIQNQQRQAVKPHLTVRNSAGQVDSLAISNDAKYLAIGLEDHSVRIWDLKNGVELARVSGNFASTRITKISPDNRLVVIGDASGLVTVADLASGAAIARINTGQGSLNALDVSRDGTALASAGSDKTVRLWDIQRARELATFRGSTADISSIGLSPDGSHIAGGTGDARIYVWARASAAAPEAVLTAPAAVIALTYDATGRLITTTADGAIQVWTGGRASPTRSFRAASSAASAQVTGDGRYVALTDANTRVNVFDVESGRAVKELSGPPGSSRVVVVDLNERRLLTGGADGAVRVWNLSSGANLAQIISTLNGWAVVDEQGRFDGSQQGVADVQWATDQTSLAIDNFSSQYFEPGLLAKQFADRPGFIAPAPSAVTDGITLPPRVAIATPSGPFTAGQSIQLTVTAEDQGGGISDIRLFQNGKLVSPDTLRTETRPDATTLSRIYQLQLNAQENRIEAIATNQQQLESSPTLVVLSASGAARLPTLHIVTIGINRYRDSRFDLDYGVPDAKAVLQRMSASIAGVFQRIVAYQMLDDAATRSKILELFAALRQIPPDDVLVVYVASHGEIVGDEWYLIPHDANFASPEGLAHTGISAGELRDAISRVGAQRVMLMIDSCKSGGSIDVLAGAVDKKVLRSLGREAGVAILAASRKDQLAAELPALGHGAFTYVVLDALSGKADQDPKDGKITAAKVLAYASRILPQFTKHLADYTQVPVAYNRGSDFLLEYAPK
ncbi:MAG TPA: caspase family protein [Stellaceae bacterium]|nr:caspase family protein [Stellaceae bacterium]